MTATATEPRRRNTDTTAATRAAAIAAQRRRLEKAAGMLRAAGWTVTEPEDAPSPE